jgi:hypothetical protein
MTRQEPAPLVPDLPRSVRYLVGTLSMLVLLSAIPAAVGAAVLPRPPVWVMTGFEVVIALAGVIGIQTARGRYNDGQGLALLCVAGTLFVAGFLTYLGTRQGLPLRGPGQAPTSTMPWMLGRLALAGVFGLLAAYSVLRRSPEGPRLLLRGILLGVPAAAIMAPFILARGVPASLGTMPGPVRGGLLAILAIIVMGLLCVSGHFVIRAFESAREPRNH